MTEIIKELVNLKFHFLTFCAGLVALYMAVFSSLPNPENDWQLALRPEAHAGLIAFGIALIIVSVFSYIFNPDTSDPPRIIFARTIRREFNSLSDTQKEILRTLHEFHKVEASLEDFHAFFEKKLPGKISSRDEFYFRLKDLANKRLVY